MKKRLTQGAASKIPLVFAPGTGENNAADGSFTVYLGSDIGGLDPDAAWV
jgi:hypothetical protein